MHPSEGEFDLEDTDRGGYLEDSSASAMSLQTVISIEVEFEFYEVHKIQECIFVH